MKKTAFFTYNREKYNLDDINEGRVLFRLYEMTGKEKYRLAAGYRMVLGGARRSR